MMFVFVFVVSYLLYTYNRCTVLTVVTVAILAQGTSWAVAAMQAFFYMQSMFDVSTT